MGRKVREWLDWRLSDHGFINYTLFSITYHCVILTNYLDFFLTIVYNIPNSNQESFVSHYEHADYLREIVRTDALRQTAMRTVEFLEKMEQEGQTFDSIAFRGMSGALIAVPVALAMGKEMIVVRKDTDSAHSFRLVEGYKDCKRYIILDDLVSSGMTCSHIWFGIKEFAPEAVCLGCVCVNDHCRINASWMNESRLASAKIRIDELNAKKRERDKVWQDYRAEQYEKKLKETDYKPPKLKAMPDWYMPLYPTNVVCTGRMIKVVAPKETNDTVREKAT